VGSKKTRSVLSKSAPKEETPSRFETNKTGGERLPTTQCMTEKFQVFRKVGQGNSHNEQEPRCNWEIESESGGGLDAGNQRKEEIEKQIVDGLRQRGRSQPFFAQSKFLRGTKTRNPSTKNGRNPGMLVSSQVIPKHFPGGAKNLHGFQNCSRRGVCFGSRKSKREAGGGGGEN